MLNDKTWEEMYFRLVEMLDNIKFPEDEGFEIIVENDRLIIQKAS